MPMDDMQIVEVETQPSVYSTSVDEVELCKEAETEPTLHRASVEEVEWCKEVEKGFTPYEGQEFCSVDEAEKFYKIYAQACGFDVRKYTTKKWRDGTVKSKLFVCNREGFKEDAEKGTRNCKITRVGCKARIRLYIMNEVISIDRFHAGHNHELVSIEDREFQKLNRSLTQFHKEMIVSNSRLKIGATRTYNICKELVKGYENIGAGLNDFKNYHRDFKCFIHERDGQLFVDHFKCMAETRKGFYFDYDVDDDGSLRRAIWADGTAIRNYEIFGDAVSYDPTYGTNRYSMVFTPFTGVDHHKRSVNFCCALIAKEDYESFDWVFSRFLIAMGGKEPEYIITDQDPGIIKSVGKKFKTARHRFCMWHIMNKVPTKFGAKRVDYPQFLKKLNAIVWDDDMEAAEFDKSWKEIMEAHDVGVNDWFADTFLIRRQWVMAHCRDLRMGGVMRTTQRSESENSFFKRFEDKSGTLVEFWMRLESAMDQQRHTQKKLDCDNKRSAPKTFNQIPIEKHAADVYTHEVFDVFQEEITHSIGWCTVRGFCEKDGWEVTKVNDKVKETMFEVQYYPGTYDAICSCRMFERIGILCRHIVWIYSSHGLNKIPPKYIAKRWTKDAVRGHDVDCVMDTDIIDGKQIEMTKLWSEVHTTMGVLRGLPKVEVEGLSSLIRGFRERLTLGGEELNKQQELEQILGCSASQEISILPPKHSKNKGTGKRMMSSKAKAIIESRKPKRMCKNCKQMACHDKRNCPNPPADMPPQVEEMSENDEAEDDEEGIE